jgi:hypothetical protein
MRTPQILIQWECNFSGRLAPGKEARKMPRKGFTEEQIGVALRQADWSLKSQTLSLVGSLVRILLSLCPNSVINLASSVQRQSGSVD